MNRLILGAVFVFAAASFAQIDDSTYINYYVKLSDDSYSDRLYPEASFEAWLGEDDSRIVTDNSIRYDGASGGNINQSSGTMGVELTLFNPDPTTGDTLHIRFTNLFAGERALYADEISFPLTPLPSTITTSPVSDIPPAPFISFVAADSATGERTINWKGTEGYTYDLYRTDLTDTVPDGRPLRVYDLVARGLTGTEYGDAAADPDKRYEYILFAVNGSGVRSVRSIPKGETVPRGVGNELTITYIHRSPEMDWVDDPEDPTREGWPYEGQTISWDACVMNWHGVPLYDVKYEWYEDGVFLDSGRVDLPPGDTAYVSLSRTWTFDRREITFKIDPDNEIPEEEELNNELTIITDALAVGFYVEEEMYYYFRKHQHKLGVHSECWGDWAQRHISRWNEMMEDAVFELTPNGVLDRVRLDKITVVPDGALPLAGGLPTNSPNRNDRTIDLQWGFVSEQLNSTFYRNHTGANDANPFYFEGSLFHELGHARYLVDVYGFNVHYTPASANIKIKEGGQLVAGSSYMPMVSGDQVFRTPFSGLMASVYTSFDEYSAITYNLKAGARATHGTWNSPGDIGTFMNDLPDENIMYFYDANETDGDGDPAPLVGATVEFYQATFQPDTWYGKHYDDTADVVVVTDSLGAASVGKCPFAKDGHIDHGFGLSESVAVVRVEHEGRVAYFFLQSAAFNFEYWRGDTEVGRYQFEVDFERKSVDVGDAYEAPAAFGLRQNYPNPFNPATSIEFSIDAPSHAVVKVYDLSGALVKTLANETMGAGTHCVRWNGRNDAGENVASGVYLYRLQAGAQAATRKMILLR